MKQKAKVCLKQKLCLSKDGMVYDMDELGVHKRPFSTCALQCLRIRVIVARFNACSIVLR